MKQVNRILPAILMFSCLALAHEGVEIDINSAEAFNPHCSYRVYIDELKTSSEAMQVSENELKITATVDVARYTDIKKQVMPYTLDLTIHAENKTSATTSKDLPSIKEMTQYKDIAPEQRTGTPPWGAGDYRQALSDNSYIYQHSCKEQ
ncbi:hypothetical protein EOPP23_17420 [Endozoicomonas sp. OPT23]|uniref:hypothetical protein n=1 Tax=Endozoicomonas sp. OPT23 TaxID=2072845 RepID=UPI00129AD003|nr:hypothetical protein [Endozoicomonas sp. OPT23]MRI34764.1 hypothetical protein [Endozoicomonas sp. OPT23]